MTKLSQNILYVKYITKISDDLKDVLMDIIIDKFNSKLFNLLKSNEKLLVKRFCTAFKFNLNLKDDEIDKFNESFQILLGEYSAGSTSPEVKRNLLKYVRIAIAQNLIRFNDGLALLISLTGAEV